MSKSYALNWDFERLLCTTPCIGVDEAGRGPLAGPVVAAAVMLPDKLEATPVKLMDSKAISESARNLSYDWIKAHCLVGIGAASVREIEQLNILEASMLAMQRAVERLEHYGAQSNKQLPVKKVPLLIDGTKAPLSLAPRALCVIKGDKRCPSIAAASIVAKVMRDRIMQNLDARYPCYGYAQHKGYPTQKHRKSIAENGISVHHRRTFRLLASAE